MTLFLGFQVVPHPEWRDRVGPLKAPGQYKKADSIEKWIEAKWKELEADPTVLPLGCMVQSVAFHSLGSEMAQVKPNKFLEIVRDLRDTPKRLIGFDIKDRMLELMLTVFDQGADEFPHWLLRNQPWNDERICELIDPWTDSDRADLKREDLLRILPLKRNATAAARTDDEKMAREQALLVEEVAGLLVFV